MSSIIGIESAAWCTEDAVPARDDIFLAYLHEHPCVDCGETDPVVLQFDHDDRNKKSCNVGDLLRSRVPWVRILTEIEKCSVRCANDHQRRTAEQFGWYKLDPRPETPRFAASAKPKLREMAGGQ